MGTFLRPGTAFFCVTAIYFLFFPTIQSAGALFLCGSVYCFETFYSISRERKEALYYDANIEMIQKQIDEIKRAHEEVLKSGEETKKLLSQANLSRAMGNKQRLT